MDAFELAALTEHLQTGVLVTDADLRVVYANQFESDFYRLANEELVGRDIMTTCHKPKSRETIGRMVEQMRAGEMEQHAKFAVGQLIRYKARRDGDGEFAGIIRTRMWLPEGFDAASVGAARLQESE